MKPLLPRMTGSITPRYSLRNWKFWSGLMDSDKRVKARMSENRTDMSRETESPSRTATMVSRPSRLKKS